MRPFHLAAIAIAGLSPVLFTAAAQAAPAQMAPVRVEFTRPGGMPGAARDIAGSSTRYMIAPAQPNASGPSKKRKSR
jgi:hypothetical protein